MIEIAQYATDIQQDAHYCSVLDVIATFSQNASYFNYSKPEIVEDNIIDMMVSAVTRSKDLGIKTIGVNAEDASRTSMDFLLKFGNAARKAGADRIRYCDTLGYERCFRIHFRCKTLAKELEMPIELHTHNDLGMAVATAVEGAKGVVEEGQDAYINTTINGMGERAGNTDCISTLLAATIFPVFFISSAP